MTDYIVDQGLCYDRVGRERREDKLCNASLDVGDNLFAIGIPFVGVTKRIYICVQRLVGVSLQSEGYAGDATFFTLFIIFES